MPLSSNPRLCIIRIPYAFFTDNVVRPTSQLFMQMRDLNSLHARREVLRGELELTCPSPCVLTESVTSGTGERPVAVLTHAERQV